MSTPTLFQPPISSGKHILFQAVLMLGAVVLTEMAFAADSYPEIGPLPVRKAPDAAAVELGKRLFFDARISGDGAISCARCHDPAKGFGDGMPLSEAYPGTSYFRNAPTLINVRFKEDFADTGWAWDGRMGANLNDVMRDQLTETTIMNMDMRIMHERMKQDPIYAQACIEIYGTDCSSGMARKALVAFIETLQSNDAPFDTGKMSSRARKGKKLFTGKAGCINCHNGPYFSDGVPHNTGVPEALEIFQDPVRHLTYRSVLHTYGVPNMAAWRRDVGYFLVSKKYEDVGKFVTPTLRELNYTAPYMHNGVFASLEEVVDYYNKGGDRNDPLPTELKPLGLSNKEQSYLVDFLKSLSSETPVMVERMEIPQDYELIDNWLEVAN